MRSKPIIAMDGPAGAGKSTVAKEVAKRLGFVLVDTGALYRALAWTAKERGLNWNDGAAMGALAQTLNVRFEQALDGTNQVWVEDQDRSAEIRTPEISQGASIVSAHPAVRQALLDVQRNLGQQGGVVMEGRDIGTIIFPDAEYKFFVTAEPRIRAERRWKELQGKGVSKDLESIFKEMMERDDQDTQRMLAPLRSAKEAIRVDTTDLSIEEVVNQLVQRIRTGAE